MMTPAVDKRKLSRLVAAYKLRLAEKAAKIGARLETWRGNKILPDEEKKHLTAQDKYRLTPYPFPGLRSFAPDEGKLFFGRKKNVDALRAILAKRRLVVVLGGSGSGKSSLVRAGLLPFLNTSQRIEGRNGNWYVAEFRPRTDPFGALAKALVDDLLLPLLRLRRNGIAEAMGLAADADCEEESTVRLLQDWMRQRFMEAKKAGREQVLKTILEIADQQLNTYDRIVTRDNRLAAPNLFLLIDQLEEVFRPEIVKDEREALLNLIVDLHNHMRDHPQRGGLFLAATIRSEEVHRCAEHRGLSEVVIGSGYQIELLDPKNPEDAEDLRQAIIQPARNVFTDWGLGEHLDHDDAPFEQGMPARLLKGAARLSDELDHRPDQLPLLQHALQATWHSAMRRWSDPDVVPDKLEIKHEDLPGQTGKGEIPDLGACLETRADKAQDRAAERFAEDTGTNKTFGTEALRAAFRALARRDDRGNWARRFAGKEEITAFLKADQDSAVAKFPDQECWNALKQALHVFLLRGYMSRGGEGKYDISHEALIRNWPLFQDWLRDPEEVAYALGRVLVEVKEPEKFEKSSGAEKMRLIPEDLAERVAKVREGGELPTRWGEDQIAPYLLRSGLSKRWGSDKQKALQRLTELAVLAKDAAADKAGRRMLFSFLGVLVVGGAVLATVFLILNNQLKVERAELNTRAFEEQAKIAAEYAQKSTEEALASDRYAKDAVAYSLIGSMQYKTYWPAGLREFAAQYALTMLSGEGKKGDVNLLRATAWKSWDSGVRNLLGQTLRVEKIDEKPTDDSQLSCKTIKGISPQGVPNDLLESNPVPLAEASNTDVRFVLDTTATGKALLFQTRRHGTDKWQLAKEVAQFAPVAGTRLCLAKGGSALIVSVDGAALPNLFELNWYACRDDASCGESGWRMERRTIQPVPLPGVYQGATFNCVHSVKITPRSENSFSRTEVDFTDETIDECDGNRNAAANGFRGVYLRGIVWPMLNNGDTGRPEKLEDCQGDQLLRKCELTTDPEKKLTLTLTRNDPASDRWTISIDQLDPYYPIKGLSYVGPPIAEAKFDARKNIWLGDKKDQFWVLFNDRDIILNALDERAKLLQKWDKWKEVVAQETMIEVPDDELKK